MIQNFDYFGNPEKPQIILTKPTGEELFEIGNYSGFNTDLRYNDVSEISFNVFDDGSEKFNLIKGKKYVEIEEYGTFIISDASLSDDGLKKIKKVSCKSAEYELSYKKITLAPTTYKLYDAISPSNTLLGIIISLIPSWSIGSIDTSVSSLYRYFDIEDVDILSFMYSNLEDAYQCVVEFDYKNREINIKALESVGEDTNIYLSFDNLIESIDFSELSDEIVTNLRVYGGNDLNIRSVNPTGSDSIINLDYFKTTEWMSQSLIDSINLYNSLYTSKKALYENYLISYKSLNEELGSLNVELGLLKNQLTALETLQRERVQNNISILSLYTDIVNKQTEINSKNNQISNKTAQINSIIDLLNDIVDDLSLSNNFTTQQIIDLDKLIITYTYQNEAYIITDSMTESEKVEQAQMLLEDGITILERLSQPRFSFKISIGDFIKLSNFESFTRQLELANKIYIEMGDGSVVESRIISYSHDWDSNKLELELTSKYRTNDATYSYEELYSKSVSAGISVSFSKFQYKDWTRESKDDVTSFINSSLNASLNSLISTTDQDMIFDTNGLRGRQNNGSGGYLDEQTWLTNNMLAFTTDAWRNAKMAIGKINDSRYGEVWGIVAPYLVGNIIAGNNLRISNTANQFTLDENGAVLTDASFTLTQTNGKGKIILDPDVGIKIQNNSTGTFTDGIYLGADGRIKANYLDISGNATFGGTLVAGISISSPVINSGSITGTNIIGTNITGSNIIGTNISGGNIEIGTSNKVKILDSLNTGTIEFYKSTTKKGFMSYYSGFYGDSVNIWSANSFTSECNGVFSITSNTDNVAIIGQSGELYLYGSTVRLGNSTSSRINLETNTYAKKNLYVTGLADINGNVDCNDVLCRNVYPITVQASGSISCDSIVADGSIFASNFYDDGQKLATESYAVKDNIGQGIKLQVYANHLEFIYNGTSYKLANFSDLP